MTVDEVIVACHAIVERGTKPTLPEVGPLIAAYLEHGPTELHIVLDDGNYQNHFIRWCSERAERRETVALASVLLLLSNSQRRRLL